MRGQAAGGEDIVFLHQEGGRGQDQFLFVAALRGGVGELPGINAGGDFGEAGFYFDTGGGEDAAIVAAAGAGAGVVDGALVVQQHGAVAVFVIAHHQVAFGASGGGEQQRARDAFGGFLVGFDVDEHRRAATGVAIAAGNVGVFAHASQPLREFSSGYRCGHSSIVAAHDRAHATQMVCYVRDLDSVLVEVCSPIRA